MASLFSYLTVGLTSHLFCHYNIGQIKREVRTKSPRGYTYLAESEAEEYNDGYYACRSSPWDDALTHLTQALPDLEAA